jgi:hypothetical protein
MNQDARPTKQIGNLCDDPETLRAIIGPVALRPASGEWISAREARLMVARLAAVTLSDAESALCRRALHTVRVRAQSMSRREDPDEYIDRFEYFQQHKPDLSHFSDAPSRTAFEEIAAFFKALDGYVAILAPGGVSVACWATGDFKIALKMDFSIVTLEVLGLEFDRKGVLESVGAELADSKPKGPRSGGPGRPARWDWEGALAAVVASANTPDGLPEGHGAQAAIERLIADYFGADGPSESQIRLRAGRIMEALKANQR